MKYVIRFFLKMHCFFLHSTQCFIKLEVGIHSNPTPNCLVSQVPESMGVLLWYRSIFS